MSKRRYLGLALIFGVSGYSAIGCGTEDPDRSDPAPASAGPAARAVQVVRESGVTNLYGPALAHGKTAREAARSFVAKEAARLGVAESELRLLSGSAAAGAAAAPEIPVKYEPKTRSYAFSLLRYEQHRGGIPVHGGDLDVLVRNAPGHPVVMARSRVRSLGSFVPRLGSRFLPNAAQAQAAAQAAVQRTDFQGRAIQATGAPLTRFTQPQPTIWAGSEGQTAAPVMAVVYIAETDPSAPMPEKWRIVADAATGAVLEQQSLIVFENVTGSVGGFATAGAKAAHCSEDAVTPYAYATAAVQGGSSAFAGADGAFTIQHAASDPVTVQSPIQGQFFHVFDVQPARDELLTALVTPPGPADFLHNPTRTDEFVRAQSNAYVQANQVRDWLLAIHPAYPTIASQTAFPVFVNRTDLLCPGNAWYDFSSINFCVAGPSHPNTAFGSVTHHEYGHHIVTSGGSGQGPYGEGMADTIAMLIADDPGLAYGFFSAQCGSPLRTADNTCQYSPTACSTCGSASHSCGNLLSGTIWSIRNALKQVEPTDYLSILSNLVVNSILLHKGTAIDSQLGIDLLTLDDNDGNIDNGTPHRSAICAGLEAHGLTCPPLLTGLGVTGQDLEIGGEPGGPFAPESATYTLENLGPDGIGFQVSADVPWLTVSGGSGTLALGETATITVSVNAAANELALGDYQGTLQFINTTDGVGNTTKSVELSVGAPRPIYTWNMDSAPPWSAQGQWQHGQPTGAGGTFADPSAGFTGTNVFGYNLSGPYSALMPETHLTTAAIDCSDLSDVQLKFRRWLCIESSSWDHAYVRVSTDNVNWTTIWQNGTGTINDQSWSLQEFDLSSIADGAETLYVRWTMGTTDSIIQYCGWNIDDVEIWGRSRPDTGCTSDAECSDGSFCNGSELCSDGLCAPGTPPNCSDGIDCTADSCDEGSDACVHTPSHVLCDNGLFCDGSELCNAQTGCSSGAPPCAPGTCDEAGDRCVQCSSDAECDDGSFCNGAEQCSNGACSPGMPVDCDDGIACTLDGCVETSQSCSHSPNQAACDNGLHCDGVETCSATQGCLPGSPVVCNDGIACTLDACDETTDGCSFTPDHMACDNGLFCDGAETCSATSGCVSGNLPCTATCDETTDSCPGTGCTTNADCDDGNFCDGTETCSAGACASGTSWGPACDAATPLARNQQSGSFNTTGERWYVVTDPLLGWQASEVQGRIIRVNGVQVARGQMPLPPRVNGKYYFQFTAGSVPWSSWSFW